MNIQLSGSNSKKKGKSTITYGLNDRKSGNVFQTESSDEDEGDEHLTKQQVVNRAIALEQQQRASAHATTEEYDFDGTYVERGEQKDEKASSGPSEQPQKSRYIADLMQAAQKRKQERDIVYERKVAREQAAEEAANPDYHGKQSFVTATYKRKLEERKVWEANQEEQDRLEAENDVTKQSDGMMSFYGNFNKNIAVGGTRAGALEGEPAENHNEARQAGLAKVSFERNSSDTPLENKHDDEKSVEHSTREKQAVEDLETRRKRQRKERERKVEEARIRYFERHPL